MWDQTLAPAMLRLHVRPDPCRSEQVQISSLLKKYTQVYIPGCEVDLGATLTRKNLHSEELGETKAEAVFNQLCDIDKHSKMVGDANYKIPKAAIEACLLTPCFVHCICCITAYWCTHGRWLQFCCIGLLSNFIIWLMVRLGVWLVV